MAKAMGALQTPALLLKGAIEPIPNHQKATGVKSLYILIPNKDGSLRPILDLRPLNEYILLEHFHVVTLQDISPLFQQGDFLAALDLKVGLGGELRSVHGVCGVFFTPELAECER